MMLRGGIIALAAIENGPKPHIPWQKLYETFHKTYPSHPHVFPAPKMVYSERSAILQGSGNALAPSERVPFSKAGNHLPFHLKLRFPGPLFSVPPFFRAPFFPCPLIATHKKTAETDQSLPTYSL